jgi:nucleoside-diphosphate-sugar epimerase
VQILITGSAGFIGSHLVERFLQDDHHVIGFDSYLSGQPANTELFLGHPNFTFVQANVSEGIAYLGKRLHWVLHFASPASPPHYQSYPIDTLLAGGHGTRASLELALRHRARFMVASTSEVYGDPQVHPQPESYWGYVNPNGPRSCYDEAKRYAEALTMAYHHTHELDVRIIRIFNTYGPRMRTDDGRVVTNFINQALSGGPITVYGDGNQTRSFQYVDDLVEGIVRLMAVTYPYPVNLGNPEEYRIRDFAEVVRELIDPTLEINYHPLPLDDPKRRQPDITLARQLLGWQPTVLLHEGLSRTVSYFVNLNSLQAA